MAELRAKNGAGTAAPLVEQALAGMHAVVTGGGRGIGAAVADALAARGARLTLMGRNEATLAARRGALSAAHAANVFTTAVDVTDAPSVERAFAAAAHALGAPAILVNNAGGTASAPFRHTDLALWHRTLALNLTGAFLATRQVVPAMVEAGFGRIVNIASTAGLKGFRYVTAYCAAKHGVVGLTRALALEVARTGITVNAICPGYTDTGVVRDAVRNISEKTARSEADARETLVSFNPQQRLIQPGEVAHAVLWLCLPGTESVTGQSLAIAGGEVS